MEAALITHRYAQRDTKWMANRVLTKRDRYFIVYVGLIFLFVEWKCIHKLIARRTLIFQTAWTIF